MCQRENELRRGRHHDMDSDLTYLFMLSRAMQAIGMGEASQGL